MFTRRPHSLLALLPLIPLALVLLAGCGPSTSASHAPAASPTATVTIRPSVFALYDKNPAVPHGPTSGWDSRYIDPGAMVYYHGEYHMFYNGITSYPAPVSVGYATSTDGLTWNKVSKNPVLLSSSVTYAPLTIFASSALVLPDGAWVMYFYTLDYGGNAFNGVATIGRATAPQPTGPWAPDPAPVLMPGKAGSWDAQSVANPSVVKTSSGYMMYYDGVASGNDTHGAIGMAISSDGIHWKKYNDPKTNNALYAESDPVLLPGASGAWDAEKLLDANVVQTETGWVMSYLSATPATATSPYSAFGYATSSDGIIWHKSAANPILSTLDVSNWLGIYLSDMLYQNGKLYLFFDAQQYEDGIGYTNVCIATHQGLLST